MTASQIWHQDDNHAIATVGACIVSVWRGPRTLGDWRAESTPIFQICQSGSPQGVLMVVIGEAVAGMPDAVARRDLDELSKARAKIIAATSVVIFGPSVRVAAIRALVTAVNIFGGSKIRVHTDVGPALDALVPIAKERGIAFDLAATRAVVDKLRKR